jgi:hypothetical protein
VTRWSSKIKIMKKGTFMEVNSKLKEKAKGKKKRS